MATGNHLANFTITESHGWLIWNVPLYWTQTSGRPAIERNCQPTHPDVRQSLLRFLFGAKGQALLFGRCKSMIWAWICTTTERSVPKTSSHFFFCGLPHLKQICLKKNILHTTLQGINISPLKVAGKIVSIFLFHIAGDMLLNPWPGRHPPDVWPHRWWPFDQCHSTFLPGFPGSLPANGNQGNEMARIFP